MARPDVALAVGLLTRAQAWPSPEPLKRAERVTIYLAGTADLALRYTRDCTHQPSPGISAVIAQLSHCTGARE
eukprot:4885049-Prymnesium_polylepis.1